ncbi:hypothetical protein [Alicyclobacillus suci]|uniref:hypothetical protein n=1 Tax=Alicyclobacillus suci TaxID=2816080 RepID=UPI001A8D0348|nr:hypothetical protein [Alicyclobacillus suci]
MATLEPKILSVREQVKAREKLKEHEKEKGVLRVASLMRVSDRHKQLKKKVRSKTISELIDEDLPLQRRTIEEFSRTE